MPRMYACFSGVANAKTGRPIPFLHNPGPAPRRLPRRVPTAHGRARRCDRAGSPSAVRGRQPPADPRPDRPRPADVAARQRHGPAGHRLHRLGHRSLVDMRDEGLGRAVLGLGDLRELAQEGPARVLHQGHAVGRPGARPAWSGDGHKAILPDDHMGITAPQRNLDAGVVVGQEEVIAALGQRDDAAVESCRASPGWPPARCGPAPASARSAGRSP